MRNVSISARQGFVLGVLAVFVFVSAIYAPSAMAQFGIKLPKVIKDAKDIKDGKNSNDSKDSKDNKNASTKAEPLPPIPPLELTSVEPNVVPPGWEGDVVITGKNFTSDLRIDLSCPGYVGLKTRDIKVESDTRATLKLELQIPSNKEQENSVCVLGLSQQVRKDFGPSAKGTPTVQIANQGKESNFTVSNASPLPKPYFGICVLGEGEMTLEQFGEAMTTVGLQLVDGCKTWVSASSIKFMARDKTIIEWKASDIKSIAAFNIAEGYALPSDAFKVRSFRIVRNDGKQYSFMDNDFRGNPQVEEIKQRLKK